METIAELMIGSKGLNDLALNLQKAIASEEARK